MPTVRKFEDLACWATGRALRRAVYRLTRKAKFVTDYPLVSQIRRAAFSVTSNIVEGFERNGNREFIQFLAVAKGSAGEIRDHLYTALDEGYITQLEFAETYRLAEDAGKLLGGLMRYLQQSGMAETKFTSAKPRNPEL